MNMINKQYKPDTMLKFRKVDVTLTYAVVNSLGELTGTDIETRGGSLDVFSGVTKDNRFKPEQRTDKAFQQEDEYELSVAQVQFILGSLYGQVKAFTARDIQQVREIRKRLNDALSAAEITPTGVDDENKDDDTPEE